MNFNEKFFVDLKKQTKLSSMKPKTVIKTFAIFALLNVILFTCVYLITLPFVNDVFWPADIKKVLELPEDERLFFTIIVVLIQGFLFNISHKEAEAQKRKRQDRFI